MMPNANHRSDSLMGPMHDLKPSDSASQALSERTNGRTAKKKSKKKNINRKNTLSTLSTRHILHAKNGR
jgi:hypothetical protein